MPKFILLLSLLFILSSSALLDSALSRMITFKSLFNHKDLVSSDSNLSDLSAYDQVVSENLCRLAVASYCNPSKVADWSCKPCQNSKIKLGNVRTFLNSSGDVFGIIGTSSDYKAVMLIFRGTLPWDIKNWIEDINFIPTAYPLCDNGCKVHQGFYGDYLQIRKSVKETVQLYQKNYNLQSLIITGHSLGGALATLAAADMINDGKKIIHFYTFGSPRVGDPKFVTWMDSKFGTKFNGRVTHGHDPVPHLPPYSFNFRHAPTQIFYESKVSKGYKICDDAKGQDSKCSNKYLTDVNVLDHLSYLDIDFSGIILACQ